MRKALGIVLALVLVAVGARVSADPLWTPRKVSFSDARAGQAKQSFDKAMAARFESYRRELNELKTKIRDRGDDAEMKRVELALEGKQAELFDNPLSRTVYRRHWDEVDRLRSVYRDQLFDVANRLRQSKDKMAAADVEAIDDVVGELDDLIVSNRDLNKVVRVLAARGWQDTGVLVRPGARVSFSASGSWAPGFRARMGKSKTPRTVFGDADKFNFQAVVGLDVEAEPVPEGTSEEAYIAGDLTLKHIREDIAELEKIEKPKKHQRRKLEQLKAREQGRINQLKKQYARRLDQAEKERNEQQRERLVQKARNGGRRWSFRAEQEGRIYLRMMPVAGAGNRKKLHEKRDSPQGSLTVGVRVENVKR